ncbi:hypothetical protein CFOL_v3_21461 [Cephalotus follicularis]|uniref:Uncharacterized protein n=1 Tax=Cephalotus follicularis TaxID=3775 RepID=A0A1Q3CD33_CEPFO|nr:hypothetical protein CFOL_v3_21461 [Cephalotus follicularis]
MASICNRSMIRSSLPTIKSAFKSNGPKSSITRSVPTPPSSARFPLPTNKSTSSPVPLLSLSRCPSELGCVQSLLPLHNAVAAARMTSCLSTTSKSCRALSQGTLCCTSPGL